jgi:hypothetical protein
MRVVTSCRKAKFVGGMSEIVPPTTLLCSVKSGFEGADA